MDDLIKYILRFIIETIFRNYIWMLWSKYIINPESSLYYKTLFYKAKNHYYSLQVLIILAFTKIFKNLYDLKDSKKDAETNVLIGIAFIVLIIVISKLAETIKRAISNYIHPNNNRSDGWIEHSRWYCGVTNDDTKRKAQHIWEKQISAMYFKSWDAGSKANSLIIEKYFHGLGMKGDSKSPGGVKSTSRYVYVFKINPNIIERISQFFESNE